MRKQIPLMCVILAALAAWLLWRYAMTSTFGRASNEILTTPVGAYLYARSSDAADTSQTLTVYGTDSGGAEDEAFSLAGKLEVKGAETFVSVAHAVLSGTAAGTVTLFDEGTPAKGFILVESVPAKDSTLTLGVAGNTTTYHFATPSRYSMQCAAASTLSGGERFVLNGSETFYYTVDGVGSGTGTAIAVLSGDDAEAVATKTVTALAGQSSFGIQRTGDTVFFTAVGLASDQVVADVDTNFTFTSLSLFVYAGEEYIRTGYTDAGVAATTSDVAGWISAAINGTGTAGVDHNISGAHDHVSSTVDGANVGITDRIACKRLLGWTLTQSGTAFSLQAPIGGVDGDVICAISSGDLTATGVIELDNEALTSGDNTLPAGLTLTTDVLVIGGKRPTIYAGANGLGADVIEIKYQTSTDGGVTWRDGQTSISNIGNQTSPRVVNPSEAIERIRLVIDNAGNAAARCLAKIVF
jgi:hypothetical protein